MLIKDVSSTEKILQGENCRQAWSLKLGDRLDG